MKKDDLISTCYTYSQSVKGQNFRMYTSVELASLKHQPLNDKTAKRKRFPCAYVKTMGKSEYDKPPLCC